MTTIQEWQGPGKRPATYQERLARIREEIKKAEAWKEREPSFETPDIVLRGLRKREFELFQTMQEQRLRLEKIRDDIALLERRLSFSRGTSQFQVIRMQLAAKRRHEAELLAEIEKEVAPNCSFCHGHGVVPVWVNGMVTDGDCPNKPYCKGGKIEKEAADAI